MENLSQKRKQIIKHSQNRRKNLHDKPRQGQLKTPGFKVKPGMNVYSAVPAVNACRHTSDRRQKFQKKIIFCTFFVYYS